MKKLVVMILCLVNGLIGLSQDKPGTESPKSKTLFKNPNNIGWYAAADFEYTQFNGKDAYLGGFSGGAIFDNNFSMGLAFLGILNSPHLNFGDVVPNQDLFLYGGYGGLKFDYMLFPDKVVFVKFPLLIGGGGVTYETANHMLSNNNYDYTYASDDFFVIEPGILVGVNFIKFIRLEVGGSYRYAPSLDLPNTDPDILSGFNAVTSLKFGKF